MLPLTVRWVLLFNVTVFPASIVRPETTGKLVMPELGITILSFDVGTAAGLQLEAVFQSVDVAPVQVEVRVDE